MVNPLQQQFEKSVRRQQSIHQQTQTNVEPEEAELRQQVGSL